MTMQAEGLVELATADLEGLWIALIRATFVAGLTTTCAPSAARWVLGKPWSWGVILLPLLVPSVVLGYAYVGPLTALPGWGAEVGYVGLMSCRFLPLAIVLLVLLPAPPVGPAAMHVAELAGRRTIGMRLRGEARNRVLVFGLVAVVAFQEFELVSLFYLPSWTVTVFDAQVGGARLGDALAMTALPAVGGGGLLVVLAWFYRWSGGRGAVREQDVRSHPPRWARLAPAIAVAVTFVVPVVGLIPSLPDLGKQVPFLREIGNSCLFGLGATFGAGALALTAPRGLLIGLALPGLCGSLVLGLTLLALFQVRALQWAYDTPLPLVLGSVLLLLPLALVLRLAVDRSGAATPARHVVSLLRASDDALQQQSARSLWFETRGNRLALAASLLFTFGFFEVVVGDLLAPTNMTPAAPRLYNLLHYGRSPGLAAMVIVMMGAAVLVASLGLLLWRLLGRRHRLPAATNGPSTLG